MSDYNQMEEAIAGLKHGLDSRVESWVAGEDIEFGYPVFGNEGEDDYVYNYHKDRADSEFDADLVTGNSIATTVNGESVTAVPFNTSHLQTMQDWIAQIEADIDNCSAMLDPGDGNNRTIWVDINGVDMTLTVVVTGGASQPTATITYESRQVFKGMSMFVQKESAQITDLEGTVVEAADAKYKKNDSINVMIDGWIWGVTSEAVDSLKTAYVEPSGANQGKLCQTVTAKVAISGVQFEKSESSAGIALVRINK